MMRKVISGSSLLGPLLVLCIAVHAETLSRADGIDKASAAVPSQYQGWLWETSAYSSGFSVQEENCYGQLDLVLNEDLTWTAAGTDEVCRGRDTQGNSRSFINPAPVATSDFEAQSTQPLVSAGGNFYEVYGEDVVGGIGEGEARVATALFAPTNGTLLFLGGHEAINEPGDLGSSGFLHVLAKTTPSIVEARTAADLEGTTWRVPTKLHVTSPALINVENSVSSVLTVNLEAGGVCSYTTSGIFPEFANNRDFYFVAQGSTGTNLDNRSVQAGVSAATVTNCSYTIDADNYLALNVTSTIIGNPTPQVSVLRFVISDDEQYLVSAPALAGPNSNPQVVSAGFRAASALAADAMDGDYLFYLVLSDYSATGTFHSSLETGRQEFDFRGRGMFSFDSSVPGTVPDGETGTWFSCEAAMVQNGFELGYTGDYGLGTVFADAEVSSEKVTFAGCDYRLDADGGLSVHVVVIVPGEADVFEATLHGYVNSNGEVFSLVLGTSEPPPSAGFEDSGSVFFVLGMQYTGDPNGNEDSDDLMNLHEFQFPLPTQTVPLLLRRSDTGRWFGYDVAGLAVASSGNVDLETGLYWTVASTSDFNGDANGDLLMRNASNGQWMISLMDGSTAGSSSGVALPKSFDWELAANADFNNDGKADVLLRNQVNGRWRMYLIDGFTVVQEATVGIAADLVWDPVASGDFDGDGAADLLIRRSDNGAWRMYRFAGTTVVETAQVSLSKTATSQFEKVADFNGDGKQDVLIRHTNTGRWRLYTMNGTQVLASSLTSLATGATWQLESAADFDSDGNTDTLLRNATTGQWRLYLLDGATVNATAVVSIPSTADYALQAVEDFNFDGNADILLRNSSYRPVVCLPDERHHGRRLGQCTHRQQPHLEPRLTGHTIRIACRNTNSTVAGQ